MRGIYSSLTKIRRKVFVEVAKLAYEGMIIVVSKIYPIK